MILPARKFLILLLIPIAWLLVLHSRTAVVLALAYDVALLLLGLVDLFLSARPGDLVFTRITPGHLSLGAVNRIGWDLHNRSGSTVAFTVTEDVPEEMEKESPALSGRIRAQSQAQLRYGVRPTRRGLYELGDLHLRYWMPLGLLIRQHRIRARDEVKVYPNVHNLARYELAVRRHRLVEMGLSATRQRGKGSMFESLRDYVRGDDPADIAWKATARRGRIITRNYETDRSQNVLLVIDCGRLMTTQVENVLRLDYAINASLLLAHVAVKQGDYIGMLAFSDRIESYVPPVRGRAALTRMNEALYRLEPRLCEPNYELACRFLALRHRKRSLIVILTAVIDAQASSMLLAYSARFARRHLPLCVTMRDLEVEGLCSAAPQSAADCFTKTIALQMHARRAEALGRMQKHGVDLLDVDPRQLTPRLLNRYLALKRAQRI